MKKRRLMIELGEREFALKEREARLPLQLANERYEACVKMMTLPQGEISCANLLWLKDIVQREINMVLKKDNECVYSTNDCDIIKEAFETDIANQSKKSNDKQTKNTTYLPTKHTTKTHIKTSDD